MRRQVAELHGHGATGGPSHRSEHANVRDEGARLHWPPSERDAYAAACALVASHANPWFGGSIVPFNWTLNYGPRPNVSFESEGSVVVGRATRTVREDR